MSQFPLHKICSFLIAIFISSLLISCNNQIDQVQAFDSPSNPLIPKTVKIAEVSPPRLIQELNKTFDQSTPQVSIISPQNNQTIKDTTIEVQLEVKDFNLFKDEKLAMGPHLHLFIDDQPYQAVYSTDKPIIFNNLTAGSHTLRVFASRPWHESFKNEGAYAQTTFHVFTPSDNYNPDLKKPLLTYSRPQGSYGAEPIMLDFYLTNAPLHQVAQQNLEDNIDDWRIRVTINDEIFLMDTWQPLYLEGFNQGKNWVKIEFIDSQGETVKNVFNSTIRLIDYDPKINDTLTKLVKNKISLEDAMAIAIKNYQPIKNSPKTEKSSLTEEIKPAIEKITPKIEEIKPAIEETTPKIEETKSLPMENLKIDPPQEKIETTIIDQAETKELSNISDNSKTEK